MQQVWQLDIGDLELQSDNLLKRGGAVDKELLGSAEQPHAGEQTDQPEVVIAMQMGDEDMIDLAAADLVFGHLHLGSFPAIDKKDLILHRDDLRGGVTIES